MDPEIPDSQSNTEPTESSSDTNILDAEELLQDEAAVNLTYEEQLVLINATLRTPVVEGPLATTYIKNPLFGLALIFHNYEFSKYGNFKPNENGVGRLVLILKHLKFDVKTFENLTQKEISNIISLVAKLSNSCYNSILIVVLTRGSVDYLNAKDEPYTPSNLWGPLSESASLISRPKILLLQSEPFTLPEAQSCADNETDFKLPSLADLLVLRCSYPASFFLDSFIEELSKQPTNEENRDIKQILTFVRRDISHDYNKAMEKKKAKYSKPKFSFLSTLTRAFNIIPLGSNRLSQHAGFWGS